MIQTYKVMNGIENVNKHEWFDIKQEDERRPTRATTEITATGERWRENVLETERTRLDVRRNFFKSRITKPWNDIPENVKETKSVNSFKNAYDSWSKEKKTTEKPNRR